MGKTIWRWKPTCFNVVYCCRRLVSIFGNGDLNTKRRNVTIIILRFAASPDRGVFPIFFLINASGISRGPRVLGRPDEMYFYILNTYVQQHRFNDTRRVYSSPMSITTRATEAVFTCERTARVVCFVWGLSDVMFVTINLQGRPSTSKPGCVGSS